MKKREKAFTLVELLVVISIIAILSVIAMTIYGGVQKRSRDARRKADINSIADTMEANYGKAVAGEYKGLLDTMFSAGVIPVDPTDTQNSTGAATCPPNCRYCVREGGTEQATEACPGTLGVVTERAPAGGASKPYWSVCANLETGTRYYCRKNIQ